MKYSSDDHLDFLGKNMERSSTGRIDIYLMEVNEGSYKLYQEHDVPSIDGFVKHN